MRKPLAAALVAGSLVVGAGVGATFFGPGTAIAQNSPSSSSSDPNNAGTTTGPTSNEDPAHEANETPEQEAAENNGTFHHGRPHGHGPHGPGGPGAPGFQPNEDPAHEANESPEREAQEHSAQPTAPSDNSTSS